MDEMGSEWQYAKHLNWLRGKRAKYARIGADLAAVDVNIETAKRQLRAIGYEVQFCNGYWMKRAT